MDTKPSIKNFFSIFLPALIVIFLVVFFVATKITGNSDSRNENITNFDECALAGNPVMESYPRQCATPDGRSFSEVAEQLAGSDQDEHGCIGSAGYSWCSASQKCLRVFEEFCLDAAVSIIDSIQTNFGVAFSNSQSSEFNWIVSEGEITTDVKIQGIKYSAEGVKMVDYENIEKYFNETYEPDSHNLADGVEGGLRGYYIDYMVCDLNFRNSQIEEDREALSEQEGVEEGIVNLDFECGYFNKNDIPKLVATQLIKEYLADKYDKAIDEVKVEITNMENTYASGSVLFGEGENIEGGVFLARKTESEWEVVFDGNGSIDCAKMRDEYGFPDTILVPNFCDPVVK